MKKIKIFAAAILTMCVFSGCYNSDVSSVGREQQTEDESNISIATTVTTTAVNTTTFEETSESVSQDTLSAQTTVTTTAPVVTTTPEQVTTTKAATTKAATTKAATTKATTTKATTTKATEKKTSTTTKKVTTTTKKVTTTAKPKPVTTTKKATTTTTTSADNSNDLPDGYKYKFTEKDIEELKQLCKDYAISRGVTWDETLTRANSSWCGDSGFFEYNLFFDMEDARERIKEDVDYWVDGEGTNGQQKFTTLGLEVVVEYDKYCVYPKYWQFYILT